MARYLVKFSKGYGIKFISHLDLMKSMQRGIRRAGIPISYSKGFNPHADFSFATPLAVGTWSVGEYLDIRLDNYLAPDELVEKLNASLPGEIRIIEAVEMDEDVPSLMSMVDAASYDITFVNVEGELCKDFIDDFLKPQEIQVLKQSKKGDRMVNIRPMIRELSLKGSGGGAATVHALLDSGSRSNLNPELIIQAMKDNVAGMENIEIRDIKKNETFVQRKNKLLTPVEILESDVNE